MIFLEKIWQSEYAIHHHWWEQFAVINLLKEKKWSDKTKILPNNYFNSYIIPCGSVWKNDDFIIHFAAQNDRDNLMETWSKKNIKIL